MTFLDEADDTVNFLPLFRDLHLHSWRALRSRSAMNSSLLELLGLTSLRTGARHLFSRVLSQR
jgi:hypothetical protein